MTCHRFARILVGVFLMSTSVFAQQAEVPAASGASVPTQVAPSGASQTAEPVLAPEPVDSPVSSIIKEQDQYIYDPVGRRDPFKPFKTVLQSAINTVVRKNPEQPLEKFDLSELSVVGVIWGTQRPRALVKDKNGATHTVYRGTRIGRKEGVITEIKEGSLVIVEVEYGEGTISKVPKTLNVKK